VTTFKECTLSVQFARTFNWLVVFESSVDETLEDRSAFSKLIGEL